VRPRRWTMRSHQPRGDGGRRRPPRGDEWRCRNPWVPPLNRPSVTSAQSPRADAFMAPVTASISRMPGRLGPRSGHHHGARSMPSARMTSMAAGSPSKTVRCPRSTGCRCRPLDHRALGRANRSVWRCRHARGWVSKRMHDGAVGGGGARAARFRPSSCRSRSGSPVEEARLEQLGEDHGTRRCGRRQPCELPWVRVARCGTRSACG